MANFECRQLEVGLEFMRWSLSERNNFSKGSYEPKKGAQVIPSAGSPMSFLALITCCNRQLMTRLPLWVWIWNAYVYAPVPYPWNV